MYMITSGLRVVESEVVPCLDEHFIINTMVPNVVVVDVKEDKNKRMKENGQPQHESAVLSTINDYSKRVYATFVL